MGLMVWPDIDIEVVTKDRPTNTATLPILAQLLDLPQVARVTIANHLGQPTMPQGIYLGPDITHHDLKWQVDIWLIEGDEATKRRNLLDRIASKITDENKSIILELKQILAASDRYHRGVSSLDLYTAVLEHKVTNMDEFKAYLQQINKHLWCSWG